MLYLQTGLIHSVAGNGYKVKEGDKDFDPEKKEERGCEAKGKGDPSCGGQSRLPAEMNHQETGNSRCDEAGDGQPAGKDDKKRGNRLQKMEIQISKAHIPAELPKIGAESEKMDLIHGENKREEEKKLYMIPKSDFFYVIKDEIRGQKIGAHKGQIHQDLEGKIRSKTQAFRKTCGEKLFINGKVFFWGFHIPDPV